MTRTDVMASSRSRTKRAAAMRKGSRGTSRRLTLLVALLALALAIPSVAAAAEPTSKYNQTPTTPKTGTSPSKAAKPPTPTPAKEPAPESTSVGAAKETAKSSLPFTGFDLRWSLAIGLLLMGAGLTIVGVQRRQRGRGES
jgi:hypothetical protein